MKEDVLGPEPKSDVKIFCDLPVEQMLKWLTNVMS